MKIAPSYISRERLLKKIAQRNEQRIADYTKVSSAFRPEDSIAIKDNLDSIARYAERKNINLEFEPSSENMSAAKMNVYKRNTKLIENYDNLGASDDSNMILVPSFDYIGSAKLSPEFASKEEVMNSIRTNAAEILYKPHLHE